MSSRPPPWQRARRIASNIAKLPNYLAANPDWAPTYRPFCPQKRTFVGANVRRPRQSWGGSESDAHQQRWGRCWGSCVSTPLTANVPCTPHQAPAGLAAHDSRPAITVDHVHTRATCMADLRDRAVRVMKRHGRHGQRWCCNGQGKANSDQPDHFFLL